MTVLDAFAQYRIVPVVVLDDPAQGQSLAKALTAAGLPLAEVTFRTPHSLEALAAVAEDPSMIVGAGTVISVPQVEAAVEAGARFVVSPGFSPAVVNRSRELNVPVVPGVATASEVIGALDAGITTVKFFPAEPLGGVATVRALASVFPSVRFVPTGGISPANLATYLAEPAILAIGGSWVVKSALVAQHDWDQVTRLAAEAVDIVHQAGPRST